MNDDETAVEPLALRQNQPPVRLKMNRKASAARRGKQKNVQEGIKNIRTPLIPEKTSAANEAVVADVVLEVAADAAVRTRTMADEKNCSILTSV